MPAWTLPQCPQGLGKQTAHLGERPHPIPRPRARQPPGQSSGPRTQLTQQTSPWASL